MYHLSSSPADHANYDEAVRAHARERLRSGAKHLLDTATTDICARRGGTTIGGQNE